MKIKAIAAGLAAAFALGAALPASAHDYGRGNDRWRGRAEITVRNGHNQFTVDRGDRLFYRLTDRPYNFRPGYTYVYTDRCNRWGCQVLVFNGRSRQPIDHVFAARLGGDRHNVAWNNRR